MTAMTTTKKMDKDDALPDVETTNWNAVKLLANKYGIQLRPLEEVQGFGSTASPLHHAGSPAGGKGGSSHDEVVEDLGVGTPFMITARPVEGGRTIYRFKWRGEEGGEGWKGDQSRDSKVDENNETGYDPGSDSPSSSYGRSAGKRKQASSRTLRTNRSIPALRNMASIGGLGSGKSGNNHSHHFNDKKRNLPADVKEPRQAPAKIQRGDVLGAILGLREGITAQDYSWIEGGRDNNSDEASKGRGAKEKTREKQGLASRPLNAKRIDLAHPAWKSISPFGEPVLQRNHCHQRYAQMKNWQRSPIPKLTDFGQPLFSDVDDAFDAPALPAKEGITLSKASAVNDGTYVFDVLQHYTYKGVGPLDESQIATSSPTSSPSRVRQASSSSDAPMTPQSDNDQFLAPSSILATPGDDPRFALWAIRSREDNDALILSNRDGIIDVIPQSPLQTFIHPTPNSPRTPTSGKRWSVRGSVSTSSSNDQSSSPSGPPSTQESKHSLLFPADGAFLIAASTLCLVAELTSRIDSRLLTDFFYTYRAYLSSHDLLRLLTLRFKWATAIPTGPKDEARRKIVRVRTYVVIKYWLTNFFEVDFLPDRELRRQLTDWLNALGQNEDIPDLSIIKSLKKIVRGLKKGYEQGGVGGILLSETGQSPEKVGGDAFRASEGGQASPGQPDATVNLEWSENNPSLEAATAAATHVKSPQTKNSGDAGNSNSGENWRATGNIQPIHNHPPPLPNSQSAISRVFVNTVGKLSRFKRNLNTRTAGGQYLASPNEGFEGLEFEANDSGDLLFIRGGVENFINFFNLNLGSNDQMQPSEEELTSDSTVPDGTPSLSTASGQSSSTPASSLDLDSNRRSNKISVEYGLGISQEESEMDMGQLEHSLGEDINFPSKTYPAKGSCTTADHLHHFQSDQTLRSVSTAQAAPLDENASPSSSSSKQRKSWHQTLRFNNSFANNKGSDNVVQIDDIDLSSDEDDAMVRRALRRLPGARDLRMANNVHDLGVAVRTSMDNASVSSFGRVYSASHHSMISYYRRGSTNNNNFVEPHCSPEIPRKIGIVETEMLDPDEALRGYELVKGFRLDQLDSDDEEPGDVEAALRRLEGFIDQDKQKEKQRKVEAMWLRSQAQRQREEEEAKANEEQRLLNRRSAPSIRQQSTLKDDGVGSVLESTKEEKENSSAPSVISTTTKSLKKRPVTQGGFLTSSSSPLHLNSTSRGQKVEGVTPILNSRMWAPPAPVHRSFLLNYRSEVIAQQFSLIESELFKAITWQELVTDQWKRKRYPGQVLDWESFYQASVRNKAEAQQNGQSQGQEYNVEALIARFNLTCNWVASEVVLTRHVEERAAVICKLIRIAWKCYHHSNFATLTQIILGLQSPWVERLSKTWSRVGMLEMRMLRDLKAFINPARNFKHLRTSMRDMIIQGGMEDLITSSGPPRSGYKNNSQSAVRLRDGCIPFFGLFLSDLAVNDTLPTLIEPSSPNSAVKVDPNTGHLCNLADPRAFDHLTPLPDKMELSPLINLYKYRIIAITVKSVLAFQARLDSHEFPADGNVYVKVLRIRCLEGEQLTQISHLVEP